MTKFEIWFVALDPTVGSEIQKTRPCVIISPKELDYLKTRIVAPITSKGFSAPYRIEFELLGKKAKILCDQIRAVSTDRFTSKIGVLDNKSSKKLTEILLDLFAE